MTKCYNQRSLSVGLIGAQDLLEGMQVDSIAKAFSDPQHQRCRSEGGMRMEDKELHRPCMNDVNQIEGKVNDVRNSNVGFASRDQTEQSWWDGNKKNSEGQ